MLFVQFSGKWFSGTNCVEKKNLPESEIQIPNQFNFLCGIHFHPQIFLRFRAEWYECYMIFISRLAEKFILASVQTKNAYLLNSI